jgi:uncharacterized protein (TIGR02145 family)
MKKFTLLLSVAFLILPLLLIIKGCEKEEAEKPKKLAVVTTMAITDISPASAKSGGNVTDDGNASVTARGIVWGKTENPTVDVHEGKTTNGEGLGEFSSEIAGLSPGTTYYVRAWATNSEGTAYGNELEFKTSIELPGLTTAAIINVTDTSATSGGSIQNDGGSAILQKGIVWHTETNPSLETHAGITHEGEGIGEYISELSDLVPGTTYYVKAYATNEEGTAYGEELQFTTLVVLPTLTTGEATLITSDSALVTGNILTHGGAEILERGIVWGTSENPTLDINSGFTTGGAGIGEFSAYLSGLTPSTQYFARAYATNSAGTAYGNQVSFTTLQLVMVPTVITAPVTSITHVSAQGGGEVTEGGGATVTDRGVVYSTMPNPTLADSIVYSRRGLGAYVSRMTGLMPLTEYYVRAFATNSAGTAYGEQMLFTTESEFGQPCPGLPTVKDIDGNVYATVQIGNQCWMKENLKTITYNDGTPIVDGSNGEVWGANTSGAYTWYDGEAEYKEPYGAIYNWYAVNTEKLCPTGWWVPSEADWVELSDYMTSNFEFINLDNEGNYLRSCSQVNSPLGQSCDTDEHPRWDEHSTHYGLNYFGFSALPAGSRNYTGNYFHGLGFIGYWWSSTQVDADIARYRRIYHDQGKFLRLFYDKGNGYSVRCIKK